MGIAADFVLIVLAGLCGGLLARALRLPLLVGYVAAGIVVGPHTAGPTVVQIHDIELLAEIGVALLLFSLGLEIHLRDLKPVRHVALFGGAIQILLCSAGGALLGTLAFGMKPTESLWFGAMVSVSSTMVVLKTLSAGGVTSTLASRVMIGLLVVQDLAVIPMLIILPQLADLNGALPKLASAIGLAAAFLAAVVVLGRHLLPFFLKWILAWGSRELFLVAVVAVGVGLGFAAHSVGLSFALGAFVAGVVLSESEFSQQALSDVVPLRDIFGLLFFVSVGMLFDPQFVLQNLFTICVAVVCIFFGKALILGGLARAFGYSNMAPWIIGLGLSQIGEFSFVLARTGLASGTLSAPSYNLALTCTIFTMALSPLVSSAALPLGRAWQAWRKPKAIAANLPMPLTGIKDHVILAGYGGSGRHIARLLKAMEIPFVLIETNHSLFTDLDSLEIRSVWGEVSSAEVLHAAGVADARLLILGRNGSNLLSLTLARIRQGNPALRVIVRSEGDGPMEDLVQGASVEVVQAEFEGGMEIARRAFTHFSFTPERTQEVLQRLRQEFYSGCAADVGSDSGGKGL